MQKNIQQRLLELNRSFYEQFASSFSATRSGVQPGVSQLLPRIGDETQLLDVGCGNGTLARALAARGFSGQYWGIDMSRGLISRAESLSGENETGRYQFQQVDLVQADWPEMLPSPPFDWVTSFAVLHHLPGENFRRQTASAFAKCIHAKGRVAVSVWQWHHSPRLRKRVQDWSQVGLHADDLDSGDVLLDWRTGGTVGLRYVHTFSEDSLSSLAESAGFQVVDSFYSDGKTGDLALYQVWQLEKGIHLGCETTG